MQIGLVTVVAQIFNFGLLVWLLNRFLYKPIVNVIAAREEAVKQKIAEAESLQEKAGTELAAYERQRRELESAREQYLKEAREEAQRVREQLVAQAEAEAEDARKRLLEQLAVEQRELTEAIQEGIIQQAGAVARRLLVDMGGSDVGDGVITALERRLEERPELLANAQLPVTVRVSFVPNEEHVERVRSMLGRRIGAELGEEDVVVVHDESLLLGAEVQFDGTVLTWHAKDYVDRWEREAAAIVAGKSGGDADGIGA